MISLFVLLMHVQLFTLGQYYTSTLYTTPASFCGQLCEHLLKVTLMTQREWKNVKRHRIAKICDTFWHLMKIIFMQCLNYFFILLQMLIYYPFMNAPSKTCLVLITLESKLNILKTHLPLLFELNGIRTCIIDASLLLLERKTLHFQTPK